MIDTFYYKSPLGNIEIKAEDGFVISLKFVDIISEYKASNKIFEIIKLQLDEYFAGQRKNFDVKLRLTGTEFQKKVWNELCEIPYGKTMSYKEIAESIKIPNSQRAVGNACNKNPILIIIPCHRVISASGTLSGYACNISIKRKLLEIERVSQ